MNLFIFFFCIHLAFKRNDHLHGHLYVSILFFFVLKMKIFVLTNFCFFNSFFDLKTHRAKKPYQCDVNNCEKTYCDARSLKRHKENHHAIFCHLNLPLLSKNLPADLASNLISAIKTTDGSKIIQYAPSSSNGDNSNDQYSDLDLSNAIIDPNLLDLTGTDKSQASNLLQQIMTQVDGNSTAFSILQQHIAEQESNNVVCPVCQKKFKTLPGKINF